MTNEEREHICVTMGALEIVAAMLKDFGMDEAAKAVVEREQVLNEMLDLDERG